MSRPRLRLFNHLVGAGVFMAFVLVIATGRPMGAGHRAKVESDGADRPDAGFLVIGDDRDRRLRHGFIRDRPAYLDLTIDAKHFGHFIEAPQGGD